MNDVNMHQDTIPASEYSSWCADKVAAARLDKTLRGQLAAYALPTAHAKRET